MATMELKEKLDLLAKILNLPREEIDEFTKLEDLYCWDSLAMVNMQIELMMYSDNVELSEIKAGETMADLCRLI